MPWGLGYCAEFLVQSGDFRRSQRNFEKGSAVVRPIEFAQPCPKLLRLLRRENFAGKSRQDFGGEWCESLFRAGQAREDISCWREVQGVQLPARMSRLDQNARGGLNIGSGKLQGEKIRAPGEHFEGKFS